MTFLDPFVALIVPKESFSLFEVWGLDRLLRGEGGVA